MILYHLISTGNYDLLFGCQPIMYVVSLQPLHVLLSQSLFDYTVYYDI